ncbi:hypothetical protein OROHE_019382 [Orobanche hederae]
MNRFSGKNGSNMGYQKSSSIRSSSFKNALVKAKHCRKSVYFTKARILTRAAMCGAVKSQEQERIEGYLLRQRRECKGDIERTMLGIFGFIRDISVCIVCIVRDGMCSME